MGEMPTREGLVFPALQSGGGYSGRGAVFPVESCTKQTQIPAKPRVVSLEQHSFSFKTRMKKKKKRTHNRPHFLSFAISPVSMILDRGPKFSDQYCTHMPMC